MSSSLAQQLDNLRAPQTKLLIHKKHKDSFLFNPKEAALLDNDYVYDMGLRGLEQLKKINPNFNAFDNTLFDVTSKYFERAVETSETNKKLNDQIKTFLTLLCPYYLLKPAHEALEWLIRRYHINLFNVDDLLFLILPYHETPLFPRMLKLIPIEKDKGKWYWLYDVKKREISLTKSVITIRASVDMGFLQFVSDMPSQAIKIHGSRASSLNTLFAFYCTTLIGGLYYAKHITELQISHILPSLLASLSSSLLDFAASGHMILAHLASKTCLSSNILTVLFNKLSKAHHPKLRSEATLTMIILSQNSEINFEFPEKATDRLVEAPWLISSLAILKKADIIIRPFICLLLRACLKKVDEGTYQVFVKKLVTDVYYNAETAEDILKILLEEFSTDSSEENTKWFSETIKELEHSFPQVFDSVISTALSDENSKIGKAVHTILGINTSRNDLFLKLIHTNEDIRSEAIKHIGENFKPDQVAWLSQTLLEKLKDDSPKVVQQFFSLPSSIISSLPKDILNNNLLLIIAQFSSTEEQIVMQAITMLISNASCEQDVIVLIAILPFITSATYISSILENVPAGRLEFLSILKSVASKETSASYMLWKTLSKSGFIPAIKDIISGLLESKLASHSAFWFSSALLIASKITDNPSQEDAERVMIFLRKFLHFPDIEACESNREIDENELQFFFEMSKKGKLPVQGAIYCLRGLAKSIPQHISSITSWLDLKNESNNFTISVYKVLHEGCCSDISDIRSAFTRAQLSFFKDHFPDSQMNHSESQILFLLNTLILDENFGDKSLNLVIEMLTKDANLISVALKEQSLIVPSLLILLGKLDKNIRFGALKILAMLINSLSSGFYRPLIIEIIDCSTEIHLDHEQVQIFVYKHLHLSKEIKSLLSETKAQSMASILCKLVSIITDDTNPSYIKAKILWIIELVHSKKIFLDLFPVATSLLTLSEDLREDESFILKSIFKRLDKTVADAFKNEKIWDSLRIALGDSKSMVVSDEHENGICPSALLLMQISKEFFDELDQTKQEKLISIILEKVTDVENAQVNSAAALFFKQIALDSKILVSLCTSMLTANVPLRSIPPRNNESFPSLEILETLEWKRGVSLLEFIQNKKKLSNINLLLPMLFNLLKKCLQFEEQAPVEYTKQLILSSILHVCKKLSDSGVELISMENLQVNVVVQCIRASLNPQTHHHALLALSHLAHLKPDQVLQNIMEIFTFIGTSVLRQDGAYSFQLTSIIIETIIPVLVKYQKGADLENKVTLVLKEFVSLIIDLPEHRRIPFYKKLMVTLNDGEFLWIFLCLVFENYVLFGFTAEKECKLSETGSMPRVLSYALQLCHEFSPSVIMQTTLNVLQYLSELPPDKEEYFKKNSQYLKVPLNIFDINKNSRKSFRHYKYTIVTFLSSLISSNRFVLEVSKLSNKEIFSLKNLFASLVEQILIYIKWVTKRISDITDQPNNKYWKVILNQCYDILDKTNILLPNEIFIEVVGELLQNTLEPVRRKAMELLTWKLQQPMPILQSQLHKLLGPLIPVLDSISSQALNKNSLKHNLDSSITQHAALIALKLMARHLCENYTEDFLMVLEKVTIIMESNSKLCGPVLGSLILCLGELVSLLKVRSIPFLPKFMPSLISALHEYASINSGDVLLGILITIQKIFEVVPQFLSPYLSQLLCEICILSTKYETEAADQQHKSNTLHSKLKSIRQKSSDISVRILVPAVSSAHLNLLEGGHYQAIGVLMTILSDSFSSASDLSSETVKLFLGTLEFRNIHPEPSLVECETVENPVIVAFTKLICKLSEASFRPLYKRVFDWASMKKVPRERLITFYRFSNHLSKELKSLFPLFLGIFIENAAKILNENNSANENEKWFSGTNSTEKSISLVENIMELLLVTFTHDSQKCLTKDYFNLILNPLVDQLENRYGGDTMANERVNNILIPCLANMISSTGDDSLWKLLNHQILLKTRHSSSQVRMLGLKAMCALVAKLGEDFMFLPETIPFLAERREDDVEEVQNLCEVVINDMETFTGESIQKYF